MTTALENLGLLLGGGQPEWIPFSLEIGAMPGFSAPVLRRFRQETGAESPAEYYGADVRGHALTARFGGPDPRRWHPGLEGAVRFDEWGIGHRAGAVEGGVDRMYPPLARAETVAQIEALPLPIVETAVDAGAIERHHAAGLPVFGYAGSLYEWSWWLRGMEQFLVDLMSEPALAEAVIARVSEHTLRLSTAAAELGIDVLCYYDDVGSQRGMQIAPELWRRFIKPAWRRVLETLRTAFPSLRFFLHSCGNIEPIVADIVELGFHMLHPLQPECMDVDAAFARYGARIALCGTLSAQRLLPFGSPADVRAEVQRLAALAGPSRRLLLAPSNVIQPETPWENVVAFVDEARRLRGR